MPFDISTSLLGKGKTVKFRPEVRPKEKVWVFPVSRATVRERVMR